ncbi:MAG: hypothetical protein HY720_30650 [Planctomycetes bacterium]|nr:hypothetical protein [Planctomycetota bacterium]
MNKTNDDWRGGFGSLRVPFEYKNIVLGFLAVLVFLGGVWAFDSIAKANKDEKGKGQSDEEYAQEAIKERPYDPTTVVEQFVRNQLPEKQREPLRQDIEKAYRPSTGYLSFGSPLAFWFTFRASPWFVKLFAGLWFVLVWASLGGAITRVTAMRVAKDESLSFKEAFSYVWHNKLSYLLTPLAVAGFMLVFVLCNLLAGVVGKIWVIGPFLYIVLYVLVLLSTLFILLLGIGLFFGFHMISSSISTEGGDGLQAVINVFNYVFARPWQYIVYSALIVVSVGFIWWVGGAFVDISLDTTLVSSDAKEYTFIYEKGDDEPSEIHIRDLHDKTTKYFRSGKAYEEAHEKWAEELKKLTKELDDEQDKDDPNEGLVKDMKKKIDEKDDEEPEHFSPGLSMARDYLEDTLVRIIKQTDDLKKLQDELRAEKAKQNRDEERIATLELQIDAEERKIAVVRSMKLEDIGSVGVKCAAAVLWIVIGALKLLILGYAASYVLAGSTTMYFLLRKDVDGTDYEEIVEKEEGAEFGEEVFEKKEGTAPAPAPAPSPAPPPAPSPTAEKKEEKKEEKKDEEKKS